MKRTLDNPPTVSAPFGDRFAHLARVDLADVLNLRTLMTDLDDLPGYGHVRRRLFPAVLPGVVLEVEVTACITTRP